MVSALPRASDGFWHQWDPSWKDYSRVLACRGFSLNSRSWRNWGCGGGFDYWREDLLGLQISLTCRLGFQCSCGTKRSSIPFQTFGPRLTGCGAWTPWRLSSRVSNKSREFLARLPEWKKNIDTHFKLPSSATGMLSCCLSYGNKV